MIDLFAKEEAPPPAVKKRRTRQAAHKIKTEGETYTEACKSGLGLATLQTAVPSIPIEPEDDLRGVAMGMTEPEAAAAIGVSTITLRNWRIGYVNATGKYPPRITEGKEWYKLRKSKRAPVLFDPAWVQKIKDAKAVLQEIGL